MTNLPQVYKDRATYSKNRLDELRKRIGKIQGITEHANLTIFGAGSFARYEASQYSDIDMFFLCAEKRENLLKPRTRELRLFGNLIEIAENLSFPEFSNDCEYLKIVDSPKILTNLGSSIDDHENYFTVRMLLLLESKCLFGDAIYEDTVRQIIDSYYKDYPDHEKTFQPIFLLNDICRFWKTLLMNYENKRLNKEPTEDEKTKQKVKNFKLKFSRMTTCFATIASICSYSVPVTEENVIAQIRLTPRERLEGIAERVPQVEEAVQKVLDSYAFFLEKTGLSTADLRGHFKDKESRTDMFRIANAYGDAMFSLLQQLDNCHEGRSKFLRYLVI